LGDKEITKREQEEIYFIVSYLSLIIYRGYENESMSYGTSGLYMLFINQPNFFISNSLIFKIFNIFVIFWFFLVTLDDINFHESVNLSEFRSNNTNNQQQYQQPSNPHILSLIPPDGEFTMLNYRLSNSGIYF